MSHSKRSIPLEPDDPTHFIGHRVLGRCPVCEGDDFVWCCETIEGVTSDWKESCPNLDCVCGYILSEDKDDFDVPF